MTLTSLLLINSETVLRINNNIKTRTEEEHKHILDLVQGFTTIKKALWHDRTLFSPPPYFVVFFSPFVVAWQWIRLYCHCLVSQGVSDSGNRDSDTSDGEDWDWLEIVVKRVKERQK